MSIRTVLGQRRETCSLRYEANGRGDRFDRNSVLLDSVGAGKKVLELGCSTGYISARLRDLGCRVYAIELDEGAAARARRFCEQVVVADLDQPGWESKLSEECFDVVVMGDVLEHLVDPDKVLRRAIPLLALAGCLVISLPNIVHWTQRLKILFGHFDYTSVGLLDFTHLRFFTPRTARSLIEGAGCQVASFTPVIGGRLTGHFRSGWQFLASLFPGLFAYQMLFVARPNPHAVPAHYDVAVAS